VREEVRFLIDTFDRPDGGMCIAAGNGIVGGTPFENIAAFLDECLAKGEDEVWDSASASVFWIGWGWLVKTGPGAAAGCSCRQG
jgi:hypothetical protein